MPPEAASDRPRRYTELVARKHHRAQTLLAIAAKARRLDAITTRLNDQIADRIVTARALDASWSEIAAALGVSQQAAHKRYHHLDPS